MFDKIIEYFLTFLIGAATVMWVEWYKTPKVRIDVVPTAEFTNKGRTRRFLQVEVINNPTCHWLAKIFNREEVSNCFATIEFQHLDGTSLFSKIDARWSASLEIPSVIPQGNVPFSPNLIEPLRFRDIYTNRPEPLTIAIKWDNEPDCYGFNNISYFYQDFKNPAWTIPEGNVLVRIELFVAGQIVTRTFQIHNPKEGSRFELQGLPKLTFQRAAGGKKAG
jgi:hypothetical protein